MSERAPSALNERVADVMTELLRACDEHNHHELAARINEEVARWSVRETTVVVAGELNRGKSTLLNELLGRAEMLPSQSTTATGTYVVIRHGDDDAALVHLEGRTEPIVTTPAAVGRWIVAGQRVGESGGVRAVELRLAHPLLASGIVLVDTPGVGSLDGAHGRITMATLARADALLFVIDASAPVTRPELDFLALAADRIDTVVIVCTKTDAYRGWRRIVEDDQRLLEEHAPRFAASAIVPVSAPVHALGVELAAAGTPDPTLAEESGFPALVAALEDRVVGHTVLLRLANLLRLAEHALTVLERAPRAVVEATSDDPAVADTVAGAQRRLDEFRDVAERTQLSVSDQFNLLRDHAHTQLTKLLREVSERYETDTPGVRDASAFSEALAADLRATDVELATYVQREVAEIAATAAAALDAPAFELEWPADDGTDLPLELSDRPTSVADPTARVRMMSTIASTSTGAVFAWKYMAMGSPEVAGLMGAGAGLGILAAALNARMGRRQRTLQALRTNVRSALDQVRGDLAPMVRQRTLTVQRQVEGELRNHVRQTTRDLQAVVARAQEVARSDATARQRARAEAERALATFDRTRATIATLRDELERRRSPTEAPTTERREVLP